MSSRLWLGKSKEMASQSHAKKRKPVFARYEIEKLTLSARTLENGGISGALKKDWTNGTKHIKRVAIQIGFFSSFLCASFWRNSVHLTRGGRSASVDNGLAIVVTI